MGEELTKQQRVQQSRTQEWMNLKKKFLESTYK